MSAALPDDAQLAARLKAGDRDAFVVIYQRYWEKLYAFAYARLQSKEAAEDIVQDIFIRLWSHRAERNIENLNAYLSASLKYEVLDHFRSQSVHRKHDRNLAESLGRSIDHTQDILGFDELYRELQKGLEHLPEKCRLVFEMSRNQGLPTKEISRQLDITPKTVEFHISKALKILRLKLKDFLYLAALLLLS
ncbi:MAG: RNA polymerase sigma-70 factor [Ferruginibacter sp.]|nr:RNA polymerase sigma-70 factor [Cytophagales bacterium]